MWWAMRQNYALSLLSVQSISNETRKSLCGKPCEVYHPQCNMSLGVGWGGTPVVVKGVPQSWPGEKYPETRDWGTPPEGTWDLETEVPPARRYIGTRDWGTPPGRDMGPETLVILLLLRQLTWNQWLEVLCEWRWGTPIPPRWWTNWKQWPSDASGRLRSVITVSRQMVPDSAVFWWFHMLYLTFLRFWIRHRYGTVGHLIQRMPTSNIHSSFSQFIYSN